MPDFSEKLMDELVQRELAKEQPQAAPATTAGEPERKGVPVWAKAAIYGGNMLDAESTRRFREYERTMGLRNSEMNPFMKPIVDKTPLMFGIKGLTSYGTGWLADQIAKKGHPNIAKAFALGMAAVPTFAGIHNLKEVNEWKTNNPRWREGIRGR